MTALETKTTMVEERSQQDAPFDEAQLAAAAFLARYSGRTLDAYRHDLRMFFQWVSHAGVEVLKAARPHIEHYRCSMEARGLAFHDRPAFVDGVRVLPIRPHRRPDRGEPRSVRPTAQGFLERGPRHGPRRVGHVSVHR